jgi:uncharacterized protein (DUF1697 family)
MAAFVALLRAVNVGGTGKLPMSDLKKLCGDAGFSEVRTYIGSGNVIFRSPEGEAKIKRKLEAALAAYAGKPIGVIVRTAKEMEQVFTGNPFPAAAPSRTISIFLDEPPPPDTLAGVTGRKNEEIKLGAREIYVHYGEGMGTSKLRIKAAALGTARNMNTVAKLAELARSS